jgi:hypothetical protein
MEMDITDTKLDLPPVINSGDIDVDTRIELVIYNRKFRQLVADFRKKWSVDITSKELHKVGKDNWNEMAKEISYMMSSFNPPLTNNWGYVLLRYLLTNRIDFSMVTHDIRKASTDNSDEIIQYKDFEKLRREVKNNLAPYEITVTDTGLNIEVAGHLTTNDWKSLKETSDKLIKRQFPKQQTNRSAKNIRLMTIAKDLSLQQPKLSYKQIAGKLFQHGYPEVTENSAKKLVERSNLYSL